MLLTEYEKLDLKVLEEIWTRNKTIANIFIDKEKDEIVLNCCDNFSCLKLETVRHSNLKIIGNVKPIFVKRAEIKQKIKCLKDKRRRVGND